MGKSEKREADPGGGGEGNEEDFEGFLWDSGDKEASGEDPGEEARNEEEIGVERRRIQDPELGVEGEFDDVDDEEEPGADP